ncbi:excisionase family DNA-binding protein [Corynebacterium auriscanis]|uniref:Helix-turn-helix domain-containing protein n=1 Tax=Corynebacterium auriscanis TaxID=99807 RepID=A0A0A2DG59_9CORY|nr:excisionase family DNA-binding protein [Corynebacterium auriscanis]KGM18165.1 hypothetical protein MA47_09820 [Corynebacterium auriscanis]WJY73252.1 Helix-turn-helix domain protein [Corynebacterium auriscanis]
MTQKRTDEVTTDKPRRYATIKQAAEYAACHVNTIRTQIARGELTGYRMGRRVIRVDLNELDDNMTTTRDEEVA